MNYLVSTFDGLGDGVIYYSILKLTAERNPRDTFYCTSNTFFSDPGVLDKLKLPKNIKFVSEEFRKFSKDNWEIISNFLEKQNIHKIINLRYIGQNFEKSYFDFKRLTSLSHHRLAFYDSENLSFDEDCINTREVVSRIFSKAIGIKLGVDCLSLRNIFPASKKADHVFINLHTKGEFKLWNTSKWAETISSLVSLDKKVWVYEGYSDKEREYTRCVAEGLNVVIRKKVEIVAANSLPALISYVQETKLLISVDSGIIHLADAMGVKSIGIYLTTSPTMWGGVTKKFHLVKSAHLNNCRNFYPQFGMCMNKKKKCEEIEGDNDDVDVKSILATVSLIYGQQD